MPPRTLTSRASGTHRQRENVVQEVVSIAAALDLSRDGNGLAGATTRQLAQLLRGLSQLQNLMSTEEQDHLGRTPFSAEYTPSLRCSLVQLFSSALRLIAREDTSEAGGSMRSSMGSSSCQGGPGSQGAQGGGRGSAKSTCSSSRPMGQPHSRFAPLLAACTELLIPHLAYAANSTASSELPPSSCIETAEALLAADAVAAISRLLAAENARPAGARALPVESTYTTLLRLLSILGFFSSVPNTRARLLSSFANGSLLDHIVTSELRAAAGEASASTPGYSTASADTTTRLSLLGLIFNYMLYFDVRACDSPAQRLVIASAWRTLLSGRRLQYFAAVQAVSQLHAADGGPVYGMPHEALLPAVPMWNLGGGRRQRAVLSCAGLTASITLWSTCLSQRPPVSLRPLRRRHVLALCLRAARVALGSLEQEAAEREERQQQELEGGAEELQGGAGGGRPWNGGRLGSLLRLPALRKALYAVECLVLAVNATHLAGELLRGGPGKPGETEAGGAAGGGSSGSGSSGGDGGSLRGVGREAELAAAAVAGDGGGGSGGSSSSGGGVGSCSEHGGAVSGPGGQQEARGPSQGGQEVAALAGAAAEERQPSGGVRHGARGRSLLHVPGLAEECWRLSVAAVWRSLWQKSLDEDQQRRGLEEWRLRGYDLDTTHRCVDLLAPLDLSPTRGKAGASPVVAAYACTQALPPGFSAALDVGYIPCAEAFLRRHMRGCMATASRNASDDPVTALALRLCEGQLLPLLLTHGDERQVAGLLTTLAKVMLNLVRAAVGGSQRSAARGSSSSSSRSGGGGGGGGAAGGGGGGLGDLFASTACCVDSVLCALVSATLAMAPQYHHSVDLAHVSRVATAGQVRLDSAAEGPAGHCAAPGAGEAASAYDGDTSTAAAAAATAAGAATPSGSTSAEGSAGAPAAAVGGSEPEGRGPGAGGAGRTGSTGANCAQRDQVLRLVGFALPRWLHVGIRVLETCQAHAPGTYVDHLRLAAIRDAALVAYHACDAAHEAGDARALGSWRRLPYDMGSISWMYRNVDALLPPGRARWHVGGWEPPLVLELMPAGAASGVCALGGADGAGAVVVEEVAGGGGEIVGGGEMEAGGGGRRVGAAGGGGMLPPPCDAGLLLPTCCHPLCTDLAGDSEAGMELRAWAGGASWWDEGGASSMSSGTVTGVGVKGMFMGVLGALVGKRLLYCSRECCSAHAALLKAQQSGR